MNSAKGVFYVSLFYALGSLLSVLINGYLSGSVIGMILLFLSLCLKWVKPRYFQTITQLTMNNLMLFFIPAGVGIIAAWDLLKDYIGGIFLLIVVSLILVLAVVAFVYLFMERISGKTNRKSER